MRDIFATRENRIQLLFCDHKHKCAYVYICIQILDRLKCRLSVKGERERDFNIFQRSFSVCIRATVWKEMQYRGRGDFRGENGIFLGLRNFFLPSLMGEPTCNIMSTAFKGEVGHKIDSIKGLLVTTWRFFSRTFSKLARGDERNATGFREVFCNAKICSLRIFRFLLVTLIGKHDVVNFWGD